MRALTLTTAALMCASTWAQAASFVMCEIAVHEGMVSWEATSIPRDLNPPLTIAGIGRDGSMTELVSLAKMKGTIRISAEAFERVAMYLDATGNLHSPACSAPVR